MFIICWSPLDCKFHLGRAFVLFIIRMVSDTGRQLVYFLKEWLFLKYKHVAKTVATSSRDARRYEVVSGTMVCALPKGIQIKIFKKHFASIRSLTFDFLMLWKLVSSIWVLIPSFLRIDTVQWSLCGSCPPWPLSSVWPCSLFPHSRRNFSRHRWHDSSCFSNVSAFLDASVNHSFSIALNAGSTQEFGPGPSHSTPSPWVFSPIPMASVTHWIQTHVSNPDFSSELQIFTFDCFLPVSTYFHFDVAHTCLKLSMAKMNIFSF